MSQQSGHTNTHTWSWVLGSLEWRWKIGERELEAETVNEKEGLRKKMKGCTGWREKIKLVQLWYSSMYILNRPHYKKARDSLIGLWLPSKKLQDICARTHTYSASHVLSKLFKEEERLSLNHILWHVLISRHRIHNAYCLENLTPDLAVIAVANINMPLCGALPKGNYILANNYSLTVA